MTGMTAEPVVGLLQDLLRIDSSNPGSDELEVATLIATCLHDQGIDAQIVEPKPGRASVVSRIAGRSAEPALLVHAHLDTVAAGDGWSADPLGGTISGNDVWGRGALDMKHAVAMMLATESLLARQPPRHDVVFAYLADEESGGRLGAQHLVADHPHLLAGVTQAVGEVGGFVVDGPGGPTALLQRGEKGVIWARFEAPGAGGHGAFSDPTGVPVAKLADAVGRLSVPQPQPASLGLPAWAERLVALGSVTTFVATRLQAMSEGPNVVAAGGTLEIDARTAPGDHDRALEQLIAVAAACECELTIIRDEPGYFAAESGRVVDAAREALFEVMGPTELVTFVLPAATDGRHFTQLGIEAYGFVPLPVPPGFDPLALMHAADERVPLRSLEYGARVLAEFVSRW